MKDDTLDIEGQARGIGYPDRRSPWVGQRGAAHGTSGRRVLVEFWDFARAEWPELAVDGASGRPTLTVRETVPCTSR